MSLLLIKAVLVVGLLELQVLRKAKWSSVTYIALAGQQLQLLRHCFSVMMPCGQTVNCTIRILKSCRSISDWDQPHKNVDEIILQPDNAQPDTSFKTQEAVTKLRLILTHSPFSPDVLPQISSFLESSEVQLVGKGLGVMTWLLKKGWIGCKYKIQTGTKSW